jgi:hypothetical protein
MVRRAVLWAAAALGGCGSFQDPSIVLDLRVLAMRAEPADQVIDVDLTQPVDAQTLLAQVVPTQVCALVADPGPERQLAWSMTLCPLGTDDRCDPDGPAAEIGSGLLEDPELAFPEPALCATVMPDINLIAVVSFVLQDDTLRGLGGVDYGVVLRVVGDAGNRDLDQYAAKTLSIAPRIPADRAANHNPSLDGISASVDGGTPTMLTLGRCLDNPSPYRLPAGTKVRLTPVETAGARERYTVPTLDGRAESFTESLTYQWVASAGGFSDGTTGGPHDISGNPAPLFTDYRAPAADDLAIAGPITLWIVQRDERRGVHWYESCVRIGR